MITRLAAFISLALAFASHASAAFVSGEGTPSTSSVAANAPSSVAITWTLKVNNPPAPVESPDGIFIVNGNQLPIAVAPLPAVASATDGSARLRETLFIPQSVIDEAVSSTGAITFQRLFQSGVDFTTVSINFRLAGGLGGNPRIQSIVLHFEDGSESAIVGADEELRAVADVTLANVQRLRGVWEVSSVSSGSQQGDFFQIIGSVDQYVGRQRNVEISSPDLPTIVPGEHVVRLRLTDPEPEFAPPEIVYYVRLAEPGTGDARRKAVITGPPEDARLSTSTPLSWMRVEGAATYLIEIYDDPEGPARLGARPTAGLLTPADQNRATVSVPTLDRLEQGRTYYWRLVARNAAGGVISTSELRRIQT